MIQQDNNAVSPVISVILMLGLAVSIAAIASLTAFNLQQGVSQNADVTVTLDQGANTVTIAEVGNADELKINDTDDNVVAETSSPSAGEVLDYGSSGDFENEESLVIVVQPEGTDEFQLVRQFDG